MPNRLDAIVRMVPRVKTIADIGCDHGKVAIALLIAGKTEKAICSDISEQSLEKAKRLACSKGLDKLVSLRVGNGLGVLKKQEADVAIIAGMGGELIARILQEGPDTAPGILILSCNTKAEILRNWLCSNGYVIRDEELVAEGRRYYPVILAEKGCPIQLDELELELGPVLLRKRPEALMRLLDRRIENAREYCERIDRHGSENAGRKYKEIEAKLKKYEELRNASSVE
jgi:tRNA (adenine22-N1)-methyltransferase